ncbi:hypothetical protein BsWGS_05077 [Bradybaena similaris]
MSSPSTGSSDLKTKNAQSNSLMSTSLRERLKKCGRYHPPSPSLCGSPTNTPQSAIRRYNPNSLPTTDSGDSAHLNEAYITNQDGADTPKRRTLEAIDNNSTGVTKRRKLHYSKGFVSKVSNIIDQMNVGLSPASSIISADVSLGMLKNEERQTNEGVSTTRQTTNEGVSVSSKTEPQHNTIVDMPCLHFESDDMPTGNDTADENCLILKDLKEQMGKELKVKEELLRKLKMVKMYREKNNLTELQKLIDIWRDVSQKALLDLHDLQPPPRPSLTELINHLQIDHDLIHYVAEDEMFS